MCSHFLSLILGLHLIPFYDLTAKYWVEAAIKADFTGIYLDAEQYKLMEKGAVLEAQPSPLHWWRMNWRTISSIAISRKKKTSRHCLTLPDGMKVMAAGNTPLNRKRTSLRERLLVPETRLNAAFDEFAPDAEKLLRPLHAERFAPG